MVAFAGYSYPRTLFRVPLFNAPQRSCSRSRPSSKVRPNGIYDRGKTQTNRIEARAVAEAVIAHALEFSTPVAEEGGKSLGVATFSVAQVEAITTELEVLRREHPETERFFMTGGADRFFVKNLENVQGDERDVMFVSVGYGRDKDGYCARSFGPLNRAAANVDSTC